MLVIRDAQIQSLIAPSDDDLVKLIAGAIRKTNPPRVDGLAPERIASMIRIGIERAREFGLTKAEDLGVFASLMFEISPQFYEEPAIAAVLGDATYTPEDRLSQLFVRIPDDAWTAAVDLYNETVWFANDDSGETAA